MPIRFQHCKTTILAQILWLKDGLKKREEEIKKPMTFKEFQEEQWKKIKNKGRKPKWHHLLTKIEDESLYLKVKALMDKSIREHQRSCRKNNDEILYYKNNKF